MNKKKIITFVFVILFYFIYTFWGEELGIIDNNEQKKVIESDVLDVLPVGDLRVHYLNVGQADSILIENNGKYMLIDAGNNADGDKLVNYFKDLGISEFQYVVATHAHEDHIGGMDDVINNFKVNNFYMPDVVTTTKTFEDVITSLEDKNLMYDVPEIGDKFNFEGCNFTVLSIGDDDSDLNDTSIVLRLVYGDNKFLFMGDATSNVESNILKLNVDIVSDVLKVGHHGSEYSSMISFLNKVKPKYSIISVGDDNSYGHPHDKALNNLNKVGSKIYKTNVDGTIIVDSDGYDISVSSKNINLNG